VICWKSGSNGRAKYLSMLSSQRIIVIVIYQTNRSDLVLSISVVRYFTTIDELHILSPSSKNIHSIEPRRLATTCSWYLSPSVTLKIWVGLVLIHTLWDIFPDCEKWHIEHSCEHHKSVKFGMIWNYVYPLIRYNDIRNVIVLICNTSLESKVLENRACIVVLVELVHHIVEGYTYEFDA